MTMTRRAVVVQGDDSTDVQNLVRALHEQRVTAGYLVTDDGQELALPPSVRHALEQIVGYLATGGPVSIRPIDRDYTVPEAAFLLGVSYDYLMQQLEIGAIPSHHVDGERFIASPDLLAYRAWQRERRAEGVRAIQQLSEEEGAYDG